MQAKPRRHAETGRQINPRGAHGFRIQFGVSQNGRGGGFKRMGHDVSPEGRRGLGLADKMHMGAWKMQRPLVRRPMVHLTPGQGARRAPKAGRKQAKG
jgi:hypothetical protein